MLKFRFIEYFLISFIFCGNLFAQQNNNSIDLADSSQLIESKIVCDTIYNDTIVKDTILINSDIFLQNQTNVYPPIKRDFRRLGYDTGLFLGVTVIAFGILWVMPESTTGWNKQDIKENGITDKWQQNVKAGPVIDQDDWVLNYVTHPYSGAVYFMTARSSGFTFLESFGYSALMSTFFWEYGVEAFAEIPSVQDLIITPVVGSIMGEGFFYAKKSILKSDKKILKSKVLGVTALILMDPFNTFLDACGYKQKIKPQLKVSPIGLDYNSNKTIWGLNFNVQF